MTKHNVRLYGKFETRVYRALGDLAEATEFASQLDVPEFALREFKEAVATLSDKARALRLEAEKY